MEITPERKTKIKKTLGILLIIAGALALATPFTPGAWLIFVGLELVGVRLAFWEKIKAWLSRKFRK